MQSSTLSNKNNIFEKHPKKTIGIIIFFGIIVFDVLAANILMSVGIYAPQKKIEQYYRVQDSVFHHSLKKNIEHSDAIWGSIGYKVYTNSLGFKDRAARQIDLENDNKRIVFIGDSFTEGVGYSFKDTFVGLIEKQWRSENIETLNAAISSYSPIIYYRKIKYYIEDVGLKFDRLVLFIDISDIKDDATSYAFDKNENVVNHPQSKENEPEEKLKRFITNNTILLSNLRILIRNIKKSTPEFRPPTIEDSLNRYHSLWTVDNKIYNEYGKQGVVLAKKHMTRLSGLLKQHDIKLTVAVYPWPDQIMHKDLNSKQVSVWKTWAQSHDAEFINLFPYFINKTEPMEVLRKNFIVGDVHWNAEGHKLVAKGFLENFSPK